MGLRCTLEELGLSIDKMIKVELCSIRIHHPENVQNYRKQKPATQSTGSKLSTII